MDIGFGKVHDIKPHYRMKQDGDVYKSYLNDQQEWKIVNSVNAELIRPHSYCAKRVNTNMNNQESSDWYDPGEGMEL